jgi:hypothetical protein
MINLMSLAMNATHYAALYIWQSKLCAWLYGPMYVNCFREIFVFRLKYNNIFCILIYFLHASAPSVSDRGQIIWGRMG